MNMNTSETKRLIIRPFVMEDLEEDHQLLDVDIQWAGPSFSIDQRRRNLQREVSLAQWEDTGCIYGYRAIILKETQRLIGICGFLPVLWSFHQRTLFWPLLFGQTADAIHGPFASLELEIGYALSSRHRGKGYATEAVQAFVNYAFQTLKVRRLFASTNRKNTGSIGLMERIGMRIARNPEDPDVDWPGAPGVVGAIENPCGYN
jgi:RimJ/RimL family protein N-acetyltransferase